MNSLWNDKVTGEVLTTARISRLSVRQHLTLFAPWNAFHKSIKLWSHASFCNKNTVCPMESRLLVLIASWVGDTPLPPSPRQSHALWDSTHTSNSVGTWRKTFVSSLQSTPHHHGWTFVRTYHCDSARPTIGLVSAWQAVHHIARSSAHCQPADRWPVVTPRHVAWERIALDNRFQPAVEFIRMSVSRSRWVALSRRYAAAAAASIPFYGFRIFVESLISREVEGWGVQW